MLRLLKGTLLFSLCKFFKGPLKSSKVAQVAPRFGGPFAVRFRLGSAEPLLVELQTDFAWSLSISGLSVLGSL